LKAVVDANCTVTMMHACHTQNHVLAHKSQLLRLS
jgi:hypothetical protein